MIKSRRMRSAGHVARTEAMNTGTTFWLERLKKIYHSEDLDVVGRVILKWMLWKKGGRV
jgi:hypothetical protein